MGSRTQISATPDTAQFRCRPTESRYREVASGPRQALCQRSLGHYRELHLAGISWLHFSEGAPFTK